MRLIIAGSRALTSYELLQRCMKQTQFAAALRAPDGSIILSGCARGIDTLALRWAREHGLPVEHWPADWAAHGMRAGFVRNEAMVSEADALVAIWDSNSIGTAHIVRITCERGLPVEVFDVADDGTFVIRRFNN